ncbi:YjgN family protein [Psychrobium sp. 1_MG-2023]|uniref:YjgN family protein n=1 Tax=Psychrobium sp. 1_MG-2023 TaxID=3062624 RepID=UPI000C34C381|nr:YjgN family protein [Psychrobium sp. 1_MG-2023]MDP2560735.1 YjgN family protein [Psychrobium sp. 1_MG-2023]PKF56627.1 DUF898 domain-containing protein [Alteromonadales bacterium alter-6D02]
MENSDVSTASTTTTPVVFTGKAGEFFGIWLVNILLSIVTLGIYSAWAKVRTLQYFYGNTSIDNHNFSYLATPMQILKGRILAVILFAVYTLTTQFLPMVGLAVIVAVLFLMPWLINQSLRFNSRMTSYRNVRFAFKGSYGYALLYFIILPILSVFTLYLLLPWALKKMDEYIYSNLSYGDKPLKTNISAVEYYSTSLIVLGVSIMFGVAVSIAVGAGAVAGGMSDGLNLDSLMSFAGVIMLVVYLILISVISAIYRARIRNHIFNNTEIEGLTTFTSKVSVSEYAMLLFVNTLAIVFTLGLAYPWTAIRQSAYLASVTELEIVDGAQAVLDTMEEQQSSFAEEAAEVFDVDIALT